MSPTFTTTLTATQPVRGVHYGQLLSNSTLAGVKRAHPSSDMAPDKAMRKRPRAEAIDEDGKKQRGRPRVEGQDETAADVRAFRDQYCAADDANFFERGEGLK